MNKTALVTGVTGQDGAILAGYLLEKGYAVHGVRLYEASPNLTRLASFTDHPRFHLHYGDLTDPAGLYRLLAAVKPDEIYNLAALSHVQVSFETPVAALSINTLGTLHLLEGLRLFDMKKTRFYQASSSEMFGRAPAPQNEETPFAPCSPYAVAKLSAYWLVRTYRDAYGLHASNGILFNHESPLRGEEFVTRKITRAAAALAAGQGGVLWLGNLDSCRDWGHARDYVDGMWRMLQQPAPDDYVLATGETHSVREFVEKAFSCAGTAVAWQGRGTEEKGFCRQSGRLLVAVDTALFRPLDIDVLRGDANRAREILDWRPRISFAALVEDMVAADRAAFAGNGARDDALHAA